MFWEIGGTLGRENSAHAGVWMELWREGGESLGGRNGLREERGRRELFSFGLEDFGDEAGPAGLMGGAYSPSVIAVKIFVE